VFESRQSSRFSAFIAFLACLVFALGVRDTPERPLRARPVPAPVTSEFRAVLTVEVLANEAEAKPLAGATVRVFWNDENTFRLVGSAQTNDEGRTRIAALPRGVLCVVADAPGRARSSTQLVMDEDERIAALSLLPEQTLGVTVLDEQGSPLENATVLVTANDPLPHGALTNPSGLASLNRLGAAPYRIKASARGYESAEIAGVTAPTTLRLRRLGAFIVRVVGEDQTPVSGATVTLAGTTLWPARQVTTNAVGLVTVRGLLAGSFDLRARKERLISSTELGVVLGRGEEKTITLRLIEGRFVTVWVTDGEGEPAVVVPNADVVVAESGLSAFPERGRTEANGKVTLGPFELGALSASATARDFVGTSVVAVPDETTAPLRIALRRGGTVRGTVVDVFDHPIAGASIEIIGTDFSGLPIAETPRMRELQAAGFARALTGPQTLMPVGELGITQGPIPTIPGAKTQGGDYLLATDELRARFEPLKVGSDVDNWVTRYDGSFVAHPVTPGRLRAFVRHPAYVEAQSELVTLSGGGSVDVKVVLRAGGSLEGVVVDRYGRSVGGVRVELATSTGSRVLSTYTADDGAFAFAALPSEVTLTVARAENPERAVLRERLTVREGRRETVRLVLPEARESVECQVRDERGEPVEGAEVVVASLDSGSPLRQTRFTDAEGKVLFDDARELELSISVDSPGYAPAQRHLGKAPERVTFTLKRGVKIGGRVTSVRGRVPVAMARITVISDGRRRVTISDREGSWQMADVPEGTVHLVVEGPESPVFEIDKRIERQARDDRLFDVGEIDLPEAGGVAGTVVDRRGDPVAGARVSTRALGGYSPMTAQTVGTAVSDALGNFRLSPVAIGKVTLYAVAPGVGQGHSEVIEVQRDRDRDSVTIVLKDALEDEAELATGSSVAVTLSAVSGLVLVTQVAAGSEAERAGLRAGDEISLVDGVKPTSVADARRRLSGPENVDVLIEVVRQNAHLKLRTVREQVRR
jgi:protocatechuate 3,4-dioxygenase beta subunit